MRQRTPMAKINQSHVLVPSAGPFPAFGKSNLAERVIFFNKMAKKYAKVNSRHHQNSVFERHGQSVYTIKERNMAPKEKRNKRCAWPNDNPLMREYHDTEWGVPVHDDQKLFEFLILEGAQAGLTWQTVLNKRENYRKAFKNFNPSLIARYGDKDIQRLVADQGIIRNRLKIAATIKNAAMFLKIQKEFGSFDAYIWQFVGNTPMKNKFLSIQDIPASTKESCAMSKDLLKRGFTFVGPTICYAFMQAVGMVNDHQTNCFRYREIHKQQVSERKMHHVS